MRAQLMELTPASRTVAEGEIVEQRLHERLAVVEIALDGDVVNVGLSTVVICRRCTSLTRPWGCRMKMLARGPLKASTAAPPVSPAGGADDGGALRRLASAQSMSRARSCIATSLKASVGPWKSSSSH
jgi:hypothetical protein